MTETKQQRSTRVQAVIDTRLSKYLSEEQLAPLSDPEIDILSEYFSNQQMKELRNAPSEVLQGLVSRHVKSVERQRLTNIPEDELDDMLAYYEEIAAEIEIVHCTRCDNDIAVEIKHSEYASTNYFNNPNLHWQDRFIVSIGNLLHGYRKRHDDVMGYRCGGMMENPEYKPAMQQYEKDLKKYQTALKKAAKEGTSMPAGPVHPESTGMTQIIPCGNESMMSEPELEAVSQSHLEQSVITESDIQKIKRHINQTNYKKPVKKVKDGYLLDDKFLLRKVK